jgi:Flp pilus assembly protein TadG
VNLQGCRPSSARRTTRDQSGATLVEFALVAPVLFLIVAAIIDFGLTFSNFIAVRGGVGSAARQGAVANFGPSCTLNAFSTAPSADIQHLMCTTKSRIGVTPSSKVYVKVLFDPTGSAGYKVTNGLIVCAQTPMTSTTGLTSPFLAGRFLRSKVQMSIEQTSGVTETAGEEAAPPGADWSWCR